MPVRTTVDVAVVGASAAGLRAAWAAASAGATCLLLEARDEIGRPEPPAIVAFDALWRASARPRDEAIRARFPGVRLASPGGVEVRVLAPGVVLDRTRFDLELAREARDAGAEIRTGVTDLDVRPDRALVAEDVDVAARTIVFADGARSLARKLVRPVEKPHELRWGAALRRAAPADGWLRIGLGSHAPGGRTQVTPLGDGTVRHWTFWKGGPDDAEAKARRALAVDARAMGWADAPATLERIAPDPVLQIPRELAAPGVAVCGGAGGQGGVEAGLAAGERAGRAAALAAMGERAALKRYEREWKREWLAGYRALAWVFRRVGSMGDADLDRALRPWDGRELTVGELGLGEGRWGRRLAGMVLSQPRAWPGLLRALA